MAAFASNVDHPKPSKRHEQEAVPLEDRFFSAHVRHRQVEQHGDDPITPLLKYFCCLPVVVRCLFRTLYVFLVVAHQRRRLVHFNVTSNPTAEWTAQQMREAFPDDSASRYLLRDRDSIYGEDFREQVAAMGIKEVLTAARSPWQNPFAERLIGSIRRGCLDHVIVLNRRHLRRIPKSYWAYYHRARPHLGLDKDAPIPRQVQGPDRGQVVTFPEVGGLHHRYERRAA